MGTTTLTPHQAGRAAWALRFQIEDELQDIVDRLLPEHFDGHGPIALADAGEALRRVLCDVEALEALGTPVPVLELMDEELQRANRRYEQRQQPPAEADH